MGNLGATQRWSRGTWLESEEHAYPNGGQTRRGSAVYPDGRTRRIFAGIPDTYFSIPAHGRIRGRYVAGWVTVMTSDRSDVDTGQERWLAFHIHEEYGWDDETIVTRHPERSR